MDVPRIAAMVHHLRKAGAQAAVAEAVAAVAAGALESLPPEIEPAPLSLSAAAASAAAAASKNGVVSPLTLSSTWPSSQQQLEGEEQESDDSSWPLPQEPLVEEVWSLILRQCEGVGSGAGAAEAKEAAAAAAASGYCYDEGGSFRRGVEELFELFDTNGDGMVNIVELATGVRSVLGHRGLSLQQVSALRNEMDADADGYVTLDEWTTAVEARQRRSRRRMMTMVGARGGKGRRSNDQQPNPQEEPPTVTVPPPFVQQQQQQQQRSAPPSPPQPFPEHQQAPQQEALRGYGDDGERMTEPEGAANLRRDMERKAREMDELQRQLRAAEAAEVAEAAEAAAAAAAAEAAAAEAAEAKNRSAFDYGTSTGGSRGGVGVGGGVRGGGFNYAPSQLPAAPAPEAGAGGARAPSSAWGKLLAAVDTDPSTFWRGVGILFVAFDREVRP